MALILYIFSLTLPETPVGTAVSLALALALAVVGGLLLLRARSREPFPWRADDWSHYERRAGPRPADTQPPRGPRP